MGEGWESQPEQRAPSSVTGSAGAAPSISAQGWPEKQERITTQSRVAFPAAVLTNTEKGRKSLPIGE